jgi:hypothetical protein
LDEIKTDAGELGDVRLDCRDGLVEAGLTDLLPLHVEGALTLGGGALSFTLLIDERLKQGGDIKG